MLATCSFVLAAVCIAIATARRDAGLGFVVYMAAMAIGATTMGAMALNAKPIEPMQVVCESATDDEARTAKEQETDGYLITLHTECYVVGTNAPVHVRVID